MIILTGLIAASLSSGMVLPVADGPPRFDIEQTCRQANEPATGVGRPNQSCRDDERQAQVSLQQHWTAFPVSNRGTCVEGARLVGPPSYVQVLTCLEMAAPK
ncbi:hypothetical protein [Bosea sp. PAMC 26642]|uniref:hypothetical protein n=1 Tax=Bosea sp. (strain PAMC 26642) TaxID=1792307 RepID=UPI00076FFF80|nr:hypothetical protein [Bosea sp. PAMC 26642]AMJ60300.1 hypothetical protein AXW83_08355 [Bosea sp. PAMC 26642]